jgi:hypothetical protein
MALAKRTKIILLLVVLSLLLFGTGVKALQFWWYYGYSRGTRTGFIRKVSVKGPPFCKYLSGEMAVTGASPVLTPEVWEFSVDDPADANPIVVALHDAEKRGERVTLYYRQDLHSMYRCTPSEYFVTKVER